MPDLPWVQRLNRNAPAHARIHLKKTHLLRDRPLYEFRMGNGFRVLVLSEHSAPVVSLQTWFRVGSRDELPGKTGIAHFLEHLMFNATTNYAQGEFDRLLEAAGAENNAGTWTDWTEYHETLPAKELALALALESDRMANLALESDTVESERDVVISERRDVVEDDVDGSASEELFALAFRKHGYGHPTIGHMRDIEGLTLEDCDAFYREHYHPNNATMVIVGDVEVAEAMGEVQARYGCFKSKRKRERVVRVEPAQRKERRSIIEWDMEQERVAIGYKSPALRSDDMLALQLLFDVLFYGQSAEAEDHFVYDKNLASGVSASVMPFEQPGLAQIWMRLRERVDAESGLQAFDDWLEAHLKDGVREDALERAKARSELSMLMEMESVAGLAEQIAFDEVVLGNPVLSIEDIDRVRTLTKAQVDEVARRLLRKGKRSVVLVKRKGKGGKPNSKRTRAVSKAARKGTRLS